MTLETLGWPAEPAYGQRNEKSYERHSLTSTFTSGNEAYTIGITTEATYLTKVSTTGVVLIVTGDASVEFTFRRSAGNVATQSPDPVRYAWHIDTTPGSTTATPPPVLTTFPFATQLAAVSPTWAQAEIVQSDLQLTSWAHNDQGLEYAFTCESRSNSTTVLTPGAVTANGVSVATARVTGDYSTSFQAGDWIANPNLPRQGWMVADNRTAGTFAQNQSVATEYQTGIAVSQTVNADGRLDGTDSTHVALRAYFDTQTDDNNWSRGQVDRVIDSTGTTTARNSTVGLKTAPVAGGADWAIITGSQTESLEVKSTVSKDRLKEHVEFKRHALATVANPFSYIEEGYDQTESATTAGSSTTKSSRAYSKPNATEPATDVITESDSYTRNETQKTDGTNTYSRNTQGVSAKGANSYSVGTVGDYVDNSNSTADLEANKVVYVVDWQYSGTDSRSLHDRGKSSTASTRAETEYDNGTDLSGPFNSTGKVAGEYSLNSALAAVTGAATVNSKVTSDTEKLSEKLLSYESLYLNGA